MKKKRFIPLLFAAMMLSTNFLSFATEISSVPSKIASSPRNFKKRCFTDGNPK